METAVIEKISNVARVKADYAKSSFLKCFVYSICSKKKEIKTAYSRIFSRETEYHIPVSLFLFSLFITPPQLTSTLTIAMQNHFEPAFLIFR